MNNWKETTLGEIADIIMGQSPASESYNFLGDGLPFYQGVTEFGDKYISVKSYTNSPTKIVDTGSILFSVRAPVGRVNITKKQCCIGRGNAGLIMKNGEQEFLYYLLKYLEKIILKNTTGTVFDSISGVELRKFPVSVPESKDEQKQIASVLSSLDDKIEFLRAENETLEKIAQGIFKEWFVNFTIDGKKLKLKNDIPEGWRIGKYEDIVNVVTGKGIKSEDLEKNGLYEVVGANGEIGKTNEYLFDEDLILTGRVGTLGTVYISRGKVWISDNVLISKTIAEENFYFAYFNLKAFNFESLDRGSTQPLITQTDLKNVEIILPSQKILKEWHKFASGIFDKIYLNNSQIQTLSSLRDTLLPKLMSGEK